MTRARSGGRSGIVAALVAGALFVAPGRAAAVYECGDELLEAAVGRLLLKRRLWLATAESCTGGLVSDRITNVPGSSTLCFWRVTSVHLSRSVPGAN